MTTSVRGRAQQQKLSRTAQQVVLWLKFTKSLEVTFILHVTAPLFCTLRQHTEEPLEVHQRMTARWIKGDLLHLY